MGIEPTRPVLRWHGGKWLLAKWIIGFFPKHRIYCEPFGGAASVLMRKPRSYAEIYNDLDSEVVNLFRVLRDPEKAEQLRKLLVLTPFAKEEFNEAYTATGDIIEQSRRLVIRCFMGFGSNAHNTLSRSGFRSNAHRSGTTPAHDWVNWPEQIEIFVERLRGVVIENRPANEVIKRNDGPDSLFYVDPPYPHNTRIGMKNSGSKGYRYELTDACHIELAEVLHSVKGMVVLSGYACPLYDEELYKGWERHERKALADGAQERTEVLWINKAGAGRQQSSLEL